MDTSRPSRWFSFWPFARQSYQRVNVYDQDDDDNSKTESELASKVVDVDIETHDDSDIDKSTSRNEVQSSTPLPFLQVSLVAATLYGQQFSQNVLFPFLPFMVHSYFPDLSVHELGYYAGYLGGAFSVGNVVSAYVWGRLADTYGRRPCVLFGLLGTAISIVAFGVAPTFKMALLARFFGGSLNGNNGICKTMISEMTDNTNSARGFSIIGLLGGLARLTAPGVGGLLSQPATQYPGSILDTTFTQTYPFSVPCIISAIVALISFVACLIFLEETYPLNKRMEVMAKVQEQINNPNDHTNTGEGTSVPQNSLMSLLANKGVAAACLLTGILSFLGVTQTEVFPLWVINDEEHGGFNFKANAIGTILTVLGPLQIGHQLLFYPALANYLGFRRLFMTAIAILGLSCAIMPNTFYIQALHSRPLAWAAVVMTFVLMVLSRVTCFTCTFVLLNNAAGASIRGSANGLAQTVSSIAGMLGPLTGSLLFAWSLNNNLPWPFNFHFIWILLAVICIIGYRVASVLPDDSNTSSKGTHSRIPVEEDPESDIEAELSKLNLDDISDVSDDDLFVLQSLVEDELAVEEMERLSLSVKSSQ